MKEERYSLNTTSRVDKEISKVVKKDKKLDNRFRKVFRQVEVDPFYKGLRTHKVKTSKWGEVYSSKITGDLRILWDFVEDNLIILIIDIGGHEGSRSVY